MTRPPLPQTNTAEGLFISQEVLVADLDATQVDKRRAKEKKGYSRRTYLAPNLHLDLREAIHTAFSSFPRREARLQLVLFRDILVEEQPPQYPEDATLPIGHPPTAGRQPKGFHGQKSIWLQNDLHHVVNYSSRHPTSQHSQPILPRAVPSQKYPTAQSSEHSVCSRISIEIESNQPHENPTSAQAASRKPLR
ncbi:hypothetical protein QC762_0018910 [Podospora pseudocomata]|uniref:Uncharacterized protein n=1 Tax=Podospora pseudocomata TaxID=2093779 RepID=A0ABR0GXL1_9PEZI|nr:hypothetical protein QC762_0018910 [Podospora pseudocomata]